MSVADKIQAIAQNEYKVFEAGKKSQYDKFWDIYQQNGNRTDYNYAFYTVGWNDETYNPKYPITMGVGNSSYGTFAYNKISDTKVDIIACGSTSGNMFSNAYNLTTIRKLIVDEDSSFINWFSWNSAIENLTIEGVIGKTVDIHWSINLSKASITSMINALSTTTSGLTATFSLTAVNKAFETSVGANNGSTSTEWTTLVGTKSNWTISLV